MQRILFTVVIICALGVTSVTQEQSAKVNTLGDTLPLVKTVEAAQVPTIGVTFSCSPSGPACTEFLRAVSEGMGYPGTGSRMTFIQNQTLKYLHTIGKEQSKLEAGKTAVNNAESTFNSNYPPPE